MKVVLVAISYTKTQGRVRGKLPCFLFKDYSLNVKTLLHKFYS